MQRPTLSIFAPDKSYAVQHQSRFKRNPKQTVMAILGATLMTAILIEGCDLNFGRSAQHAENHQLGLLNQSSQHQTLANPSQQLDGATAQHVRASTLPNASHTRLSTAQTMQPPLGRYVLQLKCLSTSCVVPGDAELIMNFMPDGSVHRLLIQKGQMSVHRDYAHSRAPTSSVGHWTWDAAQQQIRIYSSQGATLVYRVDDKTRQLQLLAPKPLSIDAARDATSQASNVPVDLNNPTAELDQLQQDAVGRIWQRQDDS